MVADPRTPDAAALSRQAAALSEEVIAILRAYPACVEAITPRRGHETYILPLVPAALRLLQGEDRRAWCRARALWDRADGYRWQMVQMVERSLWRGIRHLSHPSMAEEDWRQEALTGAYAGTLRWDPDGAGGWVRYAGDWAYARCQRAYSQEAGVVRVPQNTQDIRRDLAKMEAEAGRVLSDQDAASMLGRDVHTIARARAARGARRLLSMDAPLDEDRRLSDVLADEDASTAESLLLVGDELERARAALLAACETAREREVVTLRYGLDGGDGLNLREIGQHLGISRERVRQMEVGVLERARDLAQGRLSLARLERAAQGEPSRRARPSAPARPCPSITAEQEAQIRRLLRSSATLAQIAEDAGMGCTTLRRWLAAQRIAHGRRRGGAGGRPLLIQGETEACLLELRSRGLGVARCASMLDLKPRTIRRWEAARLAAAPPAAAPAPAEEPTPPPSPEPTPPAAVEEPPMPASPCPIHPRQTARPSTGLCGYCQTAIIDGSRRYRIGGTVPRPGSNAARAILLLPEGVEEGWRSAPDVRALRVLLRGRDETPPVAEPAPAEEDLTLEVTADLLSLVMAPSPSAEVLAERTDEEIAEAEEWAAAGHLDASDVAVAVPPMPRWLQAWAHAQGAAPAIEEPPDEAAQADAPALSASSQPLAPACAQAEQATDPVCLKCGDDAILRTEDGQHLCKGCVPTGTFFAFLDSAQAEAPSSSASSQPMAPDSTQAEQALDAVRDVLGRIEGALDALRAIHAEAEQLRWRWAEQQAQVGSLRDAARSLLSERESRAFDVRPEPYIHDLRALREVMADELERQAGVVEGLAAETAAEIVTLDARLDALVGRAA